MSNLVLNDQEVIKNNILDLLDKLAIAYQQTKEERQEIIAHNQFSDEDFSLFEEIELITVDLRGYASQIKTLGYIKNKTQAIKQLQTIKILNTPTIAEFYFNTGQLYETMKGYIRLLDYLRLSLLEFLSLAILSGSSS